MLNTKEVSSISLLYEISHCGTYYDIFNTILSINHVAVVKLRQVRGCQLVMSVDGELIITGCNYRSGGKTKHVGLVTHYHMFPNFIDTC